MLMPIRPIAFSSRSSLDAVHPHIVLTSDESQYSARSTHHESCSIHLVY